MSIYLSDLNPIELTNEEIEFLKNFKPDIMYRCLKAGKKIAFEIIRINPIIKSKINKNYNLDIYNKNDLLDMDIEVNIYKDSDTKELCFEAIVSCLFKDEVLLEWDEVADFSFPISYLWDVGWQEKHKKILLKEETNYKKEMYEKDEKLKEEYRKKALNELVYLENKLNEDSKRIEEKKKEYEIKYSQ